MKVGNRVFRKKADSAGQYNKTLDVHGIGGLEGSIVGIRDDAVAVKYPRGTVSSYPKDTVQALSPQLRTVLHHEKYSRNVEVYTTMHQGKGVRATANLPKNTLIDYYPGRVYTRGTWLKLKRKGLTSSTYPLDLPQLDATTGMLDESLVIDPGVGKGIDSFFAQNVTPFINEPNINRKSNCYWVIDLRDRANIRIAVYTHRGVKKGEPLLSCYGGNYMRQYKTSCETDWVTRGYVFKDNQAPVRKPDKIPQWTGTSWKWVDDAANNNNQVSCDGLVVSTVEATYRKLTQHRSKRTPGARLQPALAWASMWCIKQKKAIPSLRVRDAVAMAHAEAGKPGYSDDQRSGLRRVSDQVLRRHTLKLSGGVPWNDLCTV